MHEKRTAELSQSAVAALKIVRRMALSAKPVWKFYIVI